MFAALALLAAGCAHSQQNHTTSAPTSTAVPPPAPPSAGTTAAQPKTPEGPPALQPIHFDFDRSDIHPVDEAELTSLGEYLGRDTKPGVTISGHCDERGTVEYNIALGDRRAQAARDFLVRMGVEARRIKTISYGEARPVDPGHDEQAWSKNRRDEFELSGTRHAAR